VVVVDKDHLPLFLPFTLPLYAKMSTSGLKAIAPVPTATDFLDIVLSKTQRKTPTVSKNHLIYFEGPS
jgi:hypothetical protein